VTFVHYDIIFIIVPGDYLHAMKEAHVPFGYSETWEAEMGEVWNIYQVSPHHSANQERAERDPVRLGIIGTGGVSQGKHLPSLNRLKTIGDPVEIVAVADVDEETGEKAADIYDTEFYEDYETMIDEEDLDGVDVTTPSGISGPIVRDVLEEDCHVFREKPLYYQGLDDLDETIDVAREVCEIADERDLVLMTGFCKRYAPPYANAKAIVEDGDIGDPAMISGKMVQSWTGDRLFEEQACHLIDLFRYFMGDVSSVFTKGVDKYGVEDYDVDNAIINFEFEDGSIGELTTNNTSPVLKPWERLEVYGDGAYLRVEDAEELSLYDDEEGPTKSWSPAPPNTLLWDEEFGGYVWELENFIQAIRGNEEPMVDGWDGLAALEVARAAHESIETGEEIQL